MQILFLPISLQQSSIAYFAGMGCSLLVRHSRSDITGQGFFQNFFAEEETLTMINFLLIMFTRWQLKLMMVASISIWTLINTCEWGCWRLKHYPNTPVISVLKPFFQYVKTERIAFVQMKNNIEVVIAILSVMTWFLSWCAPMFTFIFVQLMRIKCATNMFPRQTFRMIDHKLKDFLPSALYISLIEN